MTKKAINMLGKTFGKLKVVRRIENSTYINGEALWECICSCEKGSIVVTCGSILRRGDKKSCGCIRKPEKEEYLKRLHLRVFENSTLNPVTQCMEWTGFKDKDGYGKISFTINGKERNIYAHRAMWMICKGDIPNDMFVLHKCDNPVCVNFYHLFLGNHEDNMKDKKKKGRCNVPIGEDSVHSKLKDKDVKIILDMKGKKTSAELAKQYGMASSTIRAIWQRRIWKHIRMKGIKK